ncbi:MAG: rhodanese-like domain-containing protein, partial [Spirochaetia bacterium]|nr:rhodanese-like domain-containing protein [Spirochaetia bacterium]
GEWKKGRTNLVILDVRTGDEYKSGFIEGATNIDFYAKDFKERLASLDKRKTYLVYCRSGHRSGETVKILNEQGFAQINNLTGGLLKWNAEKRALVTK